MNSDPAKGSPSHLHRDAYLYVRQSTLRQVVENTESTQRQYALRERAIALGWPIERVHVIDCDQGQSGASAADREGFQRLVAEVSLGHAGIVLGLEVSRLARNNSDWHRLLEICALTSTLILDEDGLYDPSQFNDRLLLGLKGTISEAELHVLRARLRGGILSKARRGELKTPLPVGLVYDAQVRVVLDPDRQVQDALRALFTTYERTGSGCATVRYFREQGLLFPRRLRRGVRKGELIWGPLVHSRVLYVLHNPRYAGAFFTWPDSLVPESQWW
jgi:DNA invertase Pin-like site-specific DNA recombinase